MNSTLKSVCKRNRERNKIVYSDKVDYRKEDALYHILIEEDGEIIFYKKLMKDKAKTE